MISQLAVFIAVIIGIQDEKVVVECLDGRVVRVDYDPKQDPNKTFELLNKKCEGRLK
jgi:hypothetical protein